MYVDLVWNVYYYYYETQPLLEKTEAQLVPYFWETSPINLLEWGKKVIIGNFKISIESNYWTVRIKLQPMESIRLYICIQFIRKGTIPFHAIENRGTIQNAFDKKNEQTNIKID